MRGVRFTRMAFEAVVPAFFEADSTKSWKVPLTAHIATHSTTSRPEFDVPHHMSTNQSGKAIGQAMSNLERLRKRKCTCSLNLLEHPARVAVGKVSESVARVNGRWRAYFAL